MIRHAHIAGALLAAVLIPGLLQAAATLSTTPSTRFNCDRACLAKHADAYFAALAAHDPSRLPLAKDVKYTETGIVKPLGQGVWKTVEGLPRYRLKVDSGLITEGETLLIPGDSKIVGYQQEGLTQPSRIWSRAIPVPERNSRFELLAAADRRENGIFYTNTRIGNSMLSTAPSQIFSTLSDRSWSRHASLTTGKKNEMRRIRVALFLCAIQLRSSL